MELLYGTDEVLRHVKTIFNKFAKTIKTKNRLYNMRYIKHGLDSTSLLGSCITTNDKFIFVSANGYNIFNGMVIVFYKDVVMNENLAGLNKHSVIYSPESFNTNFGIKTAATKKMLAVTGISYDVYKGVVYIYKFIKNIWCYTDKLTYDNNDNNLLIGFGYNIHFLGENKLYVTTHYNTIYEFYYDELERMFINNQIIHSFENNRKNFNMKITSDNFNNLFITNLTNIITIFNSGRNSFSYFYNNDNNKCFFGSNMFIDKKTLFLSCSLYYPFDDMPEQLQNKIFIYDIAYASNNSTISNLYLSQVITSPIDDKYFGYNLNAYNEYMLVGGSNYIYYYYKSDTWLLKTRYNMPLSVHNFNRDIFYYDFVDFNVFGYKIGDYKSFDYKIQILDSHFIVGNYMFNDLEGALFINDIFETAPSNINDNSQVSNYINNNSRKIQILFILLFGNITVILIVIFSYIVLNLFSPVVSDKKKKKDEEEELSPYKVYSYLGYVEADNIPETNYYPNHFNPHFYNTNLPVVYHTPNYYPYKKHVNVDKKHVDVDKKDLDIVKKDVDIDKNEKVVSYKGYLYDSIQQKYKGQIKPILEKMKES